MVFILQQIVLTNVPTSFGGCGPRGAGGAARESGNRARFTHAQTDGEERPDRSKHVRTAVSRRQRLAAWVALMTFMFQREYPNVNRGAWRCVHVRGRQQRANVLPNPNNRCARNSCALRCKRCAAREKSSQFKKHRSHTSELACLLHDRCRCLIQPRMLLLATSECFGRAVLARDLCIVLAPRRGSLHHSQPLFLNLRSAQRRAPSAIGKS